MRLDHRRQRGRVRRDDDVLAQAALESQPGHAEARVLVGELQVAGIVGGLRDAPRHAQLLAEGLLAPHDQPAGFLEQAAGRGTHDEGRHQVLEHGSRPRHERRAAVNGGHGAPEAEPVTRGQVAVRDRHEAREARLGGEQVVAARVEVAFLDAVSDREQLALRIEQEIEAHRRGDGPRRRGEPVEALRESLGAARRGRLHVALVTLDRPQRGLAPGNRRVARVVRPATRQGCCGRDHFSSTGRE